MDDQLGNVIDGTARARHWRRSTSKTRPADGTEARSDAPKSFAGSLLVPAEMLTAAPAEEPLVDRAEQSRSDPVSESAGVGAAGGVAAGTGGHQNPFLAPDATQVTPGVRPARWLLAALLARVVGRLRLRRTVTFAAAVVVFAAGMVGIASLIGGSAVKPRRSPVVVTASTSSWESAVAAKARMLALAARADQISERLAVRDRGQARRGRDRIRYRALAANRRSAIGESASLPSAAAVEAPASSSSAGSITSASYSAPPSTNHGSVGGAATSTGPAQPAGPAGTAAGTVGSNCNPKCS